MDLTTESPTKRKNRFDDNDSVRSFIIAHDMIGKKAIFESPIYEKYIFQINNGNSLGLPWKNDCVLHQNISIYLFHYYLRLTFSRLYVICKQKKKTYNTV